MVCIKCGTEVTKSEMEARREELWKQYGVIANIVPMCKSCRDKPITDAVVIRKISR
jgi:NAD-dependent SIR2 family protein deacetylase